MYNVTGGGLVLSNELPARQAARYQNPSEKLIAASREVSDPVWENETTLGKALRQVTT
jgi:hypothetical protein